MNIKKTKESLNSKDKNMNKNMDILKEKEDKRERKGIFNMVGTIILQWELDSDTSLLNSYYFNQKNILKFSNQRIPHFK